MFYLIKKDFMIQKRFVLLGLLYVVFFMFAFQGMGKAGFSAGIVAVSYMLINNTLAYDDKNKAELMLNSLPVKRRTIVFAKYISIFAFFGLGVVAYLLVRAGLKLSGVQFSFVPISPEGVLGALFSVTLLNSLHLPLFFKWGYLKSKMVNFVLFFAIFFGGLTGIDFLKNRSDLAWVNGITKAINNLSGLQFTLSFLAFILTIILISVALSLRFYQKRDF